jgi:hypothetical protein
MFDGFDRSSADLAATAESLYGRDNQHQLHPAVEAAFAERCRRFLRFGIPDNGAPLEKMLNRHPRALACVLIEFARLPPWLRGVVWRALSALPDAILYVACFYGGKQVICNATRAARAGNVQGDVLLATLFALSQKNPAIAERLNRVGVFWLGPVEPTHPKKQDDACAERIH